MKPVFAWLGGQTNEGPGGMPGIHGPPKDRRHQLPVERIQQIHRAGVQVEKTEDQCVLPTPDDGRARFQPDSGHLRELHGRCVEHLPGIAAERRGLIDYPVR